MILPQERTYTLKDIYSLREGVRAELVDGKIHYMAPPGRTHQALLFALARKIADYIDEKNGRCKIYLAPFAVFLNQDDTNYFEPDLSVICDPSKLDEKGCHGAPDWILEIVSPGSVEHDYITKLGKYKAAGVREYWIVDPRIRAVTVYLFEADFTLRQYTFSDRIPVGIYEDFRLDFSQLSL